ncbi:hypothetical protein MNBD_ALPHA11-2503 [hydrothermal vent metagenome]|uniref:Uncharacterized protein n=1 Tax=hydrothermal vent metagenome TaxID=652676 RepID=A0A3B0TK86_9ZZZZ
MADFVIGDGRILEDYKFFADLLSTFRSLNDWIKALIIVGFYASITACILGIIRRKPKQSDTRTETPVAAPLVESNDIVTIETFVQEARMPPHRPEFRGK